MRHKQAYDNRYCNSCQCTTRHEAKELAFACLRCGIMKYPTARIIKPLSAPVNVLPISA
jgi:hypothetical protein